MTERNAIILAAGTSSRFVPLSYEKPKGLLEVRGEVLIERQIRQLREAGVRDITIVVGYKAKQFLYLEQKYGMSLVMNEDYAIFNNTSSVIRVLDRLGDTFICSSDNFFPENVFSAVSEESYYSALYATGQTNEYCLTIDQNDFITGIDVGGHDAWYMVGHVYFNKTFSRRFSQILKEEYKNPETRNSYWEDVYIRHINELHMKIHRYQVGDIQEFDSLDELRQFDRTYVDDTRSFILKEICQEYGWKESQLHDFRKKEMSEKSLVFDFAVDERYYRYDNRKVTAIDA